MKKQLPTFLIVLVLGCFSFAISAYAQTEVSGNITSDTTWTLANSPYIVKSDIGITRGATLTIEPGVKTVFSNGTALRIAGSLQANGTLGQQIFFTGDGEWEGIIFLGPDENADTNAISSIKYSVIERMRLGIMGGFQPLLISNNIIRDSNEGVVLSGLSTSLQTIISNNFITNIQRGIVISHGGPIKISKNEIVNNGIGIWAFYNNANLDISYNNIYNNSGSNIYAQMGDTPVNAINNWWGTVNENELASKIYDYSDNIGVQVVNYKPYALEKFGDTFSGSMLTTCTSWTYSDWSSCSSNGSQTRNVISSSPNICTGGAPVLSQSCNYVAPVPSCTSSDWSCTDWNACSANGLQTKSCYKISNCQGGVSSPTTLQSCTSPQQPTTPVSIESVSPNTNAMRNIPVPIIPVAPTAPRIQEVTLGNSIHTLNITNKKIVTRKQFNRTLSIGTRGLDVTALQQILIGGGFLAGTTTGYFGQMTKAAVSAYQKQNGLEAVGVTGPKTRALLDQEN